MKIHTCLMENYTIFIYLPLHLPIKEFLRYTVGASPVQHPYPKTILSLFANILWCRKWMYFSSLARTSRIAKSIIIVKVNTYKENCRLSFPRIHTYSHRVSFQIKSNQIIINNKKKSPYYRVPPHLVCAWPFLPLVECD